MSRAARLLLAMVSVVASGLAVGAEASPAESAPTAHLTYVGASTVYVDAGQDDGLREGDELTVVRDGKVIATLKVTYLSAHHVSCSVLAPTAALVVGDSVRYVPSQAPAVATPPASSAAESHAHHGSGLHGRVGLRYLAVVDRSGNDGGYAEPAVDVRLVGYGLNGSPVDLNVDIRARRSSYSTFAGGDQTTQRMRAYSCSASYRFGPKDRLTFGRQYAPMLDGVSIFDGLMYDSDGPRWGGGVLAGFRPDPVDLSLSTDVREYGGYVRVHSRPGASSRWEFTTGAVGSYASGTVDREYLFLQALYYSKWFSMNVTQDVDFNRGWKVDVAGLDSVEPTGTYASFRVHAARWIEFTLGYDDRKNVYLYRDFVNPLTVFDDTHRQGDWGGATLRFGSHVDLGLEARESRGGTAGTSNSYSVALGAERFTRADFGVRVRGTHFSNLDSSGDLYALSTGATVGPGIHLALSGGRLEEANIDPSLDRHSTWYGIDFDAAIGLRWFVLLSVERDQGNMETQDQAYLSVMYRF